MNQQQQQQHRCEKCGFPLDQHIEVVRRRAECAVKAPGGIVRGWKNGKLVYTDNPYYEKRRWWLW